MPSTFQHASPAFLIPKSGGGEFFKLVDYRKFNAKFLYDSYPIIPIEPFTRPMRKLFADFVGALTHNKQGNVAILFVLDSFCKYVSFYPARRIAASVVINCFDRSSFPS